MADDLKEVLSQALWEFNETVSMLRDAREYVPNETDLASDIDDGLPHIQEALEAMAAAQTRRWQ